MKDEWQRARQTAITVIGCLVAIALALLIGGQLR